MLTSLTLHDPLVDSGPSMYDVVVFFVLGLGMLVVPSLTATSINGDREHGVLATLQTTLLASADIVLGKLLAAWAIAAAFLVTALPFLVWAWFEGGISVDRILVSLLVLMLVLAVVCTVGLMFSSLTARPVASAVLTYLALGALVFGTVIGFGLTNFLVTEKETVRVYGIPDDWWDTHNPPVDQNAAAPAAPTEPLEPSRSDCTTFERRTDVAHTERIWWMLALNPFVVVADAAPSRPAREAQLNAGFTPMRWISAGSGKREQGRPTGCSRSASSAPTCRSPPIPSRTRQPAADRCGPSGSASSS